MQIISCNQIKWCFYGCIFVSASYRIARTMKKSPPNELTSSPGFIPFYFFLLVFQLVATLAEQILILFHMSPEGIRYVCDWQISILRANKSAGKWNIPAHAHDNNGSLETNEENIRQSSTFLQSKCVCVFVQYRLGWRKVHVFIPFDFDRYYFEIDK